MRFCNYICELRQLKISLEHNTFLEGCGEVLDKEENLLIQHLTRTQNFYMNFKNEESTITIISGILF